MTPDRRLDQLVELATTTKAELDQVKRTGELTANGLANLTISTQKQFNELRTGQEELKVGQVELRASQEGLKTGQVELRIGQEELKAGQENLRSGQELILQILREKLL